MPIYTIYAPQNHPLFSSPTTLSQLAQSLTTHHVSIMGNCLPSEVTVIQIPNCTVLTGPSGSTQPDRNNHLRILGVVAKGRDAATKQKFFEAVREDVARLLESVISVRRGSGGKDLVDLTVALTLTECESTDTMRFAAPEAGNEARRWEGSPPAYGT